ncbi:hypothetical protein AMEX_G11346 [Astyanax mexicanus]|uniref:Uncharacterized protein n=1 Tax=Astyanax mexicanus TaxID=7994 RepID=A0A8T2M092_ASTMX|nr:hypothetical protein AMEX_G11346 [Astyanax mexicanus]
MPLFIVSRPYWWQLKRPDATGTKKRSSPNLHRSFCTKLLRAEGIPAPSNQMCLGRLVVPFGQYENGPFHWLVANDVGYMKYIIDKHRAEVADPPKKGEVLNWWVKDFLTEYAESFPPVSIVLEANIDRCIYGQRGFEDHTFIEMWELYRQYPTQKDRPEQFTADQRELIKKAYTSVRRWLHTPVTHITSVQMKRFRKFISDKDQQLQAGTSKFDPSSWQGDDMELVAASQRVEGKGDSNFIDMHVLFK